MPRIVLPLGPIRSPIFSGLICSVTMRGAYGDRSARGCGERLLHLAEDVQAAFLGLRQRLAHDLEVEPLDLDVHLDRGDALLGARDLEVHVAQVILGAEDVGEDRVRSSFLDQSHRDAGNRRVNRHARIEQRERAAAHTRHRRRAVRLEHVGDDANRVRELRELRQARPAARARPDCRGRSRDGWCRAADEPRPSRTAGSCSAA